VSVETSPVPALELTQVLMGMARRGNKKPAAAGDGGSSRLKAEGQEA
jgi:hypothetical protein